MLAVIASFFMGLFALFSGAVLHVPVTNKAVSTGTTASQTTISQEQLISATSDKYVNGNLPLGDGKYTTDNPKKGYIYLCRANPDANGGGAQEKGSWIHGDTWNLNEKISVMGHISWPKSEFSNSLTGDTRIISGNDLPSHTTGVFPISSQDSAYQFDRNPNSIKAQTFSDSFPANPVYSDTPFCMGGEVGIMLTGVVLFNGFDAQLRDAAAYEVQDGCNGHPQVTGEYHYHSLSSCITDIQETTVIGFALDGFPITGPKVAENKFLTTDDLDECHGLTSEIILDGKKTTTYHYVMTQDFPYSVSCFRGKPVSLQVIQGGQNNMMQNGQSQAGNNSKLPMQDNGMRQPPQAAITACSGKTNGDLCSFTSPNGIISGRCQRPPQQNSLVCIPDNTHVR